MSPNGGRAPCRARLSAVFATAVLLAAAYIGRAVISSDGAEVIADSLGLMVTGRLEAATIPPASIDPFFPPSPPFRSRYGAFPSIALLPVLALAWPFRGALGARGLEAAVALTWTCGAALATWAFLRLGRALRRDASALWAPAFLAGTFLWPYAADSFFEPLAAFGLAFAAERILAGNETGPVRAALAAAAGVCGAAFLKPVLWVTAPVVILGALLHWRDRLSARRFAVSLFGFLATGLAAALLVNLTRHGRMGDFGYGYSILPFVTPLATGLLGLVLSPGRGLFLYAPLAFVALFAARRLTRAGLVLCLGVPLVLLLVSGRWYGWHGGSAWGPRYLLPALPLLCAPAVLLPRKVTWPAVAAGVVVNVLGVLVAPGSWISWVECLPTPPGAVWPKAGPDRVSSIPALSPVYGHLWLLAGGDRSGALPAIWPAPQGGPPPPNPEEFVSPWVLRRLLGLPPLPPLLPRLLARTGAAYAYRHCPEPAMRFAEEALRLDPQEEDARAIIAARGRVASD
ncbi:MAG: hypothetical protein ACHQPI_13945 [Thermoanaerobaculia bacterium]